jgi:NADPH:quinone reductase-like Zn-dependent oxidoreductase
MKAIVQDRYGSPDVLEVGEVDKPVAADNEVLVRVHAAAVNARDWHIMRGDPYLARLVAAEWGSSGPKRRIRGSDLAGRVEAVGSGVTRFRPGDEVYGDVREADGAFAEYVCVPDGAVDRKPANLTFEQAAAVPLAGSTALVCLRDAGRLQSGQQVLVNGASGGVGTFAVQIAKSFGAEVTGVCSTRNVELVRSLGADHVVDYTQADFTRTGRRYDVLLDLVANRSLTDCRRALAPGGTLVLSGGGVSGDRPKLVGPMGLTLRGLLLSRFVRYRLVALTDVPPSKENLAALRDSSSPERSPRPSTGPTRWSRSPRPSGTSKRSTRARRSSSPSDRRSPVCPASSQRSPAAGSRGRAGGQQRGERVESAGDQPVVGPLAALLAEQQAGVGEDLHVVGDGGLGQRHRCGEVADAGLPVGLRGDQGQQAQPGRLGQRLEDGGEPLGRVDAHRLAAHRGAALLGEERQRAGRHRSSMPHALTMIDRCGSLPHID